ncbi:MULTISPECIES: ABC transporter substrate-binding protein [Photobacterium]|uniref:ABC transporter substrate-binding protein n=1 Tax=Photobacterium TaxID=657 RepID=UPI00069E70F7|nr:MULTISPECIES: ABC transporter substrate-binding protein [Photobacterium]MBV1842434.1 ABC transporter substrate-binding protein [Photobacterium ganghwense]PSU09416.1 amino acid ABC transporter [Photobacterium ganghwense]QSV16611.1 ABC transporter substrate-binding protein [Photobacterium ganghwense]
MRNTFCSLALTALLASLPVHQAQAKDTTLRIATEGAYPPFNYYTPDGQLAGFDIDIGRALCDKMAIKCTFVAQDWEGIIPALLAGKYDAVIASMFITEKRKEKVDFTEPYQKSAMTFVVPKESKLTDFSPSAMAGKTIGAQGATTQGDFLSALYPDSDVRLYPTQDAVNLDLVSGRLDAQVGDIIPMLNWVEKSQDGNCCKLAGELITDPKYVGEGVGIAVRQEDDKLRLQLNQALAALVADGTYQKINDKYFSLNILTLE